MSTFTPAELDFLHGQRLARLVAPGVIRIHPRRILVFGIEKGVPESRTVSRGI